MSGGRSAFVNGAACAYEALDVPPLYSDVAPMRARSVMLVLLTLSAIRHAVAEPRHCLSPDERRQAIKAHKLVPLGRAIRRVKAHYPGELLAVGLCEQGKRLLYVLTVLPRSGKVVHASVDAATGAMVGGS
jgi:hypothetical protein